MDESRQGNGGAPGVGAGIDGMATIRRGADGRFVKHRRKRTRFDAGRRARFLAALGATSNVRHAARKAGISPCTAYYRRGQDKDFAAAWAAALDEGHELLQLEMLHRARFGTRSNTVERDRDGLRKAVEKIEFRDSIGLALLTRYDKRRAQAAGHGAMADDPGDADARRAELLALLWEAEQDSDSDGNGDGNDDGDSDGADAHDPGDAA